MAIDGVMVPITLFICCAVTAVGVPFARAFARKVDRDTALGPHASADVTARLERMEQAIDSIAIEVERISEGQRFTTKLLAERGTNAAAAPPPSIREQS